MNTQQYKTTRPFNPGFRVSVFDSLFVVGVCGVSIYLMPYYFTFALLMLWAAIQFFLFCNVFRIRRTPELIWACCYMGLALMMLTGIQRLTIGLPTTAFLGMLLILCEMDYPGYHGVGWSKINPDLEEWFDEQYQP